MPALLRPHPHRGDLLAAGVVVLAVALTLLESRFDAEWGRGIHAAYTSLAAIVVLGWAIASPVAERPRAYVSILLLAGFYFVGSALSQWAQVLGAEGGGAGTVTWIALLLTLLAAWLAREKRSAIMTLVAAVAATAALLAFVEWVFEPDETAATFRYLLLVAALAFGLAAVRLRDAHRRHAVSFVDAAGLAIIAIGVALLVETFVPIIFGGFLGEGAEDFAENAAWGWELVLVAGGFGLIAYSAVDREPGPAYLGVGALALFATLAGLPGEDGASLIGWPILLLLLGGVVTAIALRPRRDLPPEPGTGGPAGPGGPEADDAVVQVRVS